MRHKEVQAQDVARIAAKLNEIDPPTPPSFVGKAMARYIAHNPRPEGELPIGHTRHYDVRTDPDTGDALVSAREELIVKVPELAGAQRDVPERWRQRQEERVLREMESERPEEEADQRELDVGKVGR